MVFSFRAYLLLSYWTLPGRISPEMIRFCFFSDTKCIRSIDVNKNLLRNGEAARGAKAKLQQTPAALQCLQLQPTAVVADLAGTMETPGHIMVSEAAFVNESFFVFRGFAPGAPRFAVRGG
jgi:hypothetical protein